MGHATGNFWQGSCVVGCCNGGRKRRLLMLLLKGKTASEAGAIFERRSLLALRT
jgi:hypothetical protein